MHRGVRQRTAQITGSKILPSVLSFLNYLISRYFNTTGLLPKLFLDHLFIPHPTLSIVRYTFFPLFIFFTQTGSSLWRVSWRGSAMPATYSNGLMG